MTPRQMFVLAGLMALGAIVSAVVPKHPLFNHPAGTVVLSGMALSFALTGIHLSMHRKSKR
jgi:fatty acid desaturase